MELEPLEIQSKEREQELAGCQNWSSTANSKPVQVKSS